MFRFRLAATRKTAIKGLVLGTGILGLAVLMTGSGHSGSSALSKNEENGSTASASVKTDQRQRLEIEVITITPDGFEPQEIVRPAGPFVLSVTNQSGIDALNLEIETEHRGKLREKLLPLETPYWREVINLPQARYVIREVNHPEWTFSLVIQ